MRAHWQRVANPVLIPAALALAMGLLLLGSADAFADDQAVTHTRHHGVGAAIGAAIAIAGAASWRPRWLPPRLARYAAIAAFTLFGAAQVESIGAPGTTPATRSPKPRGTGRSTSSVTR